MDLDLFNRASAFFTEEEALAKIKENQSAKRTRKDNNLHGDWLPVVVAGVRGQSMICEVKRCKRDSGLIYLGHEVCEYHFRKFCNTRDPNLKDDGVFKWSKHAKSTRATDYRIPAGQPENGPGDFGAC